MVTIAQAKERILSKWDWDNDKDNYPVILWGPPGIGKCVVGNTLIFTEDGLNRIDFYDKNIKYYENKIGVLNVNNEIVKSSHFYFGGRRQTIKIISSQGFEIEGTKNHRVIVFSDNGPVWKRLDQITNDDYIGINRSDKLPAGKNNIDLYFAYFVGYWVGDGHLMKNASICFLVSTILAIGRSNRSVTTGLRIASGMASI